MDVNTILSLRDRTIYSCLRQMPITRSFINGDENRFVRLIYVSREYGGMSCRRLPKQLSVMHREYYKSQN